MVFDQVFVDCYKVVILAARTYLYWTCRAIEDYLLLQTIEDDKEDHGCIME